MFDHPEFRKYAIEQVPLDQDIFLMDEKWMADYEQSLLRCYAGERWEPVGFISYAAARSVTANSLELSWYPNIYDRFHEMRIHLPRTSFVTCVECRDMDEKPRIFVKSDWLTDLYLRTNSAFAIVDAVGVKNKLAAGEITTEHLDALRNRIDKVAENRLDISFVSFADSLLLKSNWSVGQRDSSVRYTYDPEGILHVLPEIAAAYAEILGLDIYAVVTQGRNEFYRDELIYISPTRNHISLNSLGLPFAQLQAIEQAARSAIRSGQHDPVDIYMDEDFFHSLRWQYGFEKHKEPFYPYTAPMTESTCKYVTMSLGRLFENLEPVASDQVAKSS